MRQQRVFPIVIELARRRRVPRQPARHVRAVALHARAPHCLTGARRARPRAPRAAAAHAQLHVPRAGREHRRARHEVAIQSYINIVVV